jgi:hypothetical protein
MSLFKGETVLEVAVMVCAVVPSGVYRMSLSKASAAAVSVKEKTALSNGVSDV